VAYLPNTERLLVTHGSQVKTFAKDSQRNSLNIDFFDNYPKDPFDLVRLVLDQADL